MFDSGISVKNLIEELKNTEVDIALEIPDATYVTWLNSLQQLLYTEIIKEQKKKVLYPPFENNLIDLSSMAENNENTPRFEDVYAVYADDIQLIKSTVTSGVIFNNTFFKITDKLAFNATVDKELTIVYIVKPALVTTTSHGNVSDGVNVMIPIEFIDLVKAKLRGEAYKLANEDELAAKWLNDYNILLETFKAWIAEKSPNFGI
jgi:hypothetical protein